MYYITYKKLTRKLRRFEDLKHRNDWGGVGPVTKRTENRRAYSRARVKHETRIMLLC